MDETVDHIIRNWVETRKALAESNVTRYCALPDLIGPKVLDAYVVDDVEFSVEDR